MKTAVIFLYFLFPASVLNAQNRLSVSDFFNQARYSNLEQLCTDFYHKDIKFTDPLGEVNGLGNLIKYYQNLYENLISITFEDKGTFKNGNEQVYLWKMSLRHKTVGDGELIELEGVSFLRYDGDKVIYHRDYFDLGAMIYEKIPVLGSLILWIKNKAHGVR